MESRLQRSFLLVALIGMIVGGIGLVACSQATAPTPTPTPTAPATATPEPSGYWWWSQVPPELREALRQRIIVVPTPTPAPADYIDLEVGKNGCRFTIDQNATERLAGSLTDDCADLLRILNPEPVPATPIPFAPTYFQKDVEDPRDGTYARIRVYLDYNDQIVTFWRETTPGSFVWTEVRRMTNYLILANAKVHISREEDIYTVEVSYYDGSVVQRDPFPLDELFPLEAPVTPEPEPTAMPTAVPSPTPSVPTKYIWVSGVEGGSLFLSAIPGDRPGTSVLSLVGYENGYIRQDEWFTSVPVHKFLSAAIWPDGSVDFYLTTVENGQPIEFRHLPWWIVN